MSLSSRWGTFLHIIARTNILQTEDTLAGKLRLVEKLQSIGDILEDDEFDIPLRLHDGQGSGIYQSLDSVTIGSRGRSRHGAYSMATSGLSDHESRVESRGGGEGGERRHRRRRRHHGRHRRQRGLGNMAVGGNTLSRNFQRRYGYLRDQVKRQRGDDYPSASNVGGESIGGRSSRRQDIDMSDIYKTVRQKKDGRRNRNRIRGSDIYSSSQKP